jgi:hypothetical protein
MEIDLSQPGVRAITRGRTLHLTIDNLNFEGIVTSDVSAMVPTPGQMRLLDDLSVRTRNDWVMSDDVSLPVNTYLVFSEDRCEVVDYERLRREAEARDAFVDRARNRIRDAVRDLDWEEAWAALGDLKGRYPQAPATVALEGDLRTAAAAAVIDVVNMCGQPIVVRIEREGEQVANVDLDAYERSIFELERGNYSVFYGPQRGPRAEMVAVTRAQEWQIAVEVKRGAANQPAQWRYLRRDRDIDVVGSRTLRRRILAARARDDG